MKPIPKAKGRATSNNPVSRFDRLDIEADPPDEWSENLQDDDFPDHPVRTEFFEDKSKTILSTNDSPDTPDMTLNVYRGCEHGCIYCFARPTHEYLGLSAGLDFESKIFVKTKAPELLRKELSAKNYKPRPFMLSAVTDCYQPVEKKLQLTRRVLEVLAEFRHPVGIVTKNHLVTRDIDILQELGKYNAIRVMISLTTLDPELAKRMEPRTSRPNGRLKAVKELHQAGIPVGIIMGPVIPGLTEHEIPDLLRAAAEAGAQTAAYTMVRLSYGLKDLFQDWLEENYPLKKSRVLGRIRDVRDGRLNDTQFGRRKRGQGVYADHIKQLFHLHKRLNGLDRQLPPLSAGAFRRMPPDGQLSLF